MSLNRGSRRTRMLRVSSGFEPQPTGTSPQIHSPADAGSITPKIHPQLQADCHELFDLPHCCVLLHSNATLPWFILVPKSEVTDILQFPEPARNAVMNEAAMVSTFVREHWQLPKINFAAIGNMVPQLHLHIIGREPGDACWPKPVWGNLTTSRSYSDSEIRTISIKLQATCNLQ